ncbi:MAG: alpha-2-macroglobulin [Microscillaceae bacterium]
MLLFSTCSRKNLLEISQTHFKPEIDTQTNLRFSFNRPVVGDSLLNVWDTTAYLLIEPQIPGKFKWISPQEVIFSPLKSFAPSTLYQARLSPALLRGQAKGIALNPEQKIAFHTPYLNLEKAEAFWSQDERRTHQLRINLFFNYKVVPEGLRSRLKIQLGNQALDNVRVLSQAPAEVIELVLEEGPGQSLSNQPLSLRLDAGLQCAESNYTTPQSLGISIETPNRDQLNIEGLFTEYEQYQPQIRVRTNQSVPLDEIKTHLKIAPEMVYEIQLREDGFIIKGNFLDDKGYTVRIDKAMRGVFDAGLGSHYEETVVFGSKQPVISFLTKGPYLSSQGSRNLGIRISNVPRVNIKVYRIYENNLLHFLRNVNFYDNMSEYAFEADRFGDVIHEGEYETKSLPLVNDYRVISLDYPEMQMGRGLFAVRVSSPEDLWLNSNTMVSFSDIGLIARETDEDLLVFANSLLQARPLSNIKVNLVSQSNQIIASVNTNEEGVALFPQIKKKHPQADIQLVTVQNGTDFNFLHLESYESKVATDRFETGGYYPNSAGDMAFLYSERTLYRPGETIPLNVIVRKPAWKTPANVPIKLKFKLPNGKDLLTQRGLLDAHGAFQTSIALPPSALTGTYQAEVFGLNDVFLASLPISVEEFMPDRIRLALKLLEPDYRTTRKSPLRPNDSVRVQLKAQNLFGPPAANRNYEMNFYLQKQNFQPKAYPDYNFEVGAEGGEEGLANPFYELESITLEGQTDGQGLAYQSFAIQQKYENLGLLRGNVYATVFDETGRSVSRQTSFDVLTQATFIGVKSQESYVSTNRPVSFGLVALSAQEQPANAEVRVEVIRYKWQTVMERDYSDRYRYVSKQKVEKIKEETIRLNGTSSYTFTPQISGDYEVRWYLPNAQTFVSHRFYAYGYAYSENVSFPVSKDGQVDIKLDKESYQPGQMAQVLFTCPFNGRLLVTVERNRVFEHFYLDTKNKSASATLNMLREHLPNVYISATLIKPVSDGAIPLTVAHGYASVKVEAPDTRLDLRIVAAEKSESNQTQIITVQLAQPQAGVQVSLAIVDEGILQLKNYASPDPHGYFYQKQALRVQGYDLYPQLFPEITLGRPATGGGADFLGRGNPMVNKRVKLVRFWSGVLETNAAGQVSFPIAIPQFSGSLRIMAVAYQEDAFGSASQSMTVADPMVVSTGLPRFLSPRDRVKVPVSLTNTTEQSTPAEVQIQVSQALKVISESRFTLSVKANEEGQAEFEIEAASVIDSATVEVVVQAFGRTFREKLDINIRPVVGLVQLAGQGELKGGQSQEISLQHDFFPNTTQAQLWLSRSPMIRFANNLEYLVDYPYGCLEQITSSAFPQLYAQDLMKTLRPNLQNTQLYEARIRENVQEAIYRLMANQTYSGGLSYWPGSYEESWFGTAYAAHFMIEAQRIGYAVSEGGLAQMFNYLENKAREQKLVNYQYRDEQNRPRVKNIAPKEALYSLYVLALAKHPNVSLMNYYRENAQLLARDSQYLLAISYLLLGDKNSYQKLLPNGFEDEKSLAVTGGSFHSPLRDEALALNALLEGDPEHPQVSLMARHLSEALGNADNLTTQEQAFALLALGKIARKQAPTNVKAEIWRNNAPAGQFTGEDLRLSQNLAGQTLRLSAQGNGSLYYFWEMSGLSASGKVREEDRQIKVRKTFYDRNGAQIKDLRFRQNDLIIVKVSIVTESLMQDIENVAITDMLPAGLEIENPRLMPSREIRWIRTQNEPQYYDIRDDRIHYFCRVNAKTQSFYYLARAVSQGTFQMGPVSAIAMYNANYASYHGSGVVMVLPREGKAN